MAAVNRTHELEPPSHENRTVRFRSRLTAYIVLVVLFTDLTTIVSKPYVSRHERHRANSTPLRESTARYDLYGDDVAPFGNQSGRDESLPGRVPQEEEIQMEIPMSSNVSDGGVSAVSEFGNTIDEAVDADRRTFTADPSSEFFKLENYPEDVFRYNAGIILLDNGSFYTDNGTYNESVGGNYTYTEEPLSDYIIMGVMAVFLGILILITVIGNVFVIAAILLERNLQSVANYLIVSLAVADLMVACLVMPLGAVYEISRGWILGPELCDMWTSSDVLCCTASILHLVAIAVDRYWAVTNVDYIHTRNGGRIVTMIVVVWSVAIVVSLAPQFGWKDPDYLDRINLQQRCLVSQDVGYQIFATCSTFYVPLLVILVLYWKIFQTARKRIRRRRAQRNAVLECSRDKSTEKSGKTRRLNFLSKGKFLRLKRPPAESQSQCEGMAASLVLVEGQSTCSTVEVIDEDDTSRRESNVDHLPQATTAFTAASNNAATPNLSPEKSSGTTATTNNGSASHQNETKQLPIAAVRSATTPNSPCVKPPTQHQKKRDLKKESIEAKREKKAAKTLAIITGAFVVCWLPFFIMALLMPLCDACYINDYVASFFLWLGYFNSTLNPVIYTIFSPEFRQAFKRILCGVSHARHRARKIR